MALLNLTRDERKSNEYSGMLIPLSGAKLKTIVAPSAKSISAKSADLRNRSDNCPCRKFIDLSQRIQKIKHARQPDKLFNLAKSVPRNEHDVARLECQIVFQIAGFPHGFQV